MLLVCSAVLGNYQPATPGRAQRSQAISQNPQSAPRQRLSRITMDRDASSRIQNGQRANPFFLESCSDPRLLAAGGQSDVSIVEHWPAHATVVVGLGNLSDDFTNRPTVPSWHLTPASLSADRNIFLSPYLKEPQIPNC